ncbi:MAG: hypothetical protein M1609_08190, partial [Firmicutes bacterium]|nr:hypothetical protein [Bacillota bacterium]
GFMGDQAKRAGAEVLEGVRVNRVQVADHGVSVYSDGMDWQGQVLVGADGASSLVARTLGLAGEKKIAATLEQEMPLSTERLSQNRGVIKVDYGLVPAGYAWVFPKADHLSMGVGSLSPKMKDLRSLLGKVLEAEGLVDFSAQQSRGWFIPISPEPGNLHGGRALVIGDAAGLADAFTGEGIYAALFSARLAAEVLIEQTNQARTDLRRYTSLVQEKMGPELANAFRVTRWFHPVSGLVHRILRRQQALAANLIQVVAGNMTYAQFFDFFQQQLRTAWHF